MNGFVLLIPFFLVRFVLLRILGKDALQRAAFFAPLMGREKIAYWFYQISNTLIFVCLLFSNITTDAHFLIPGLAAYALGLLLCTASIVNFAWPAGNGMNQNGLYRFSRNPMYVAYFIFFLGCALLTQSLLLLAFVIVFQISAHWIILSEERWCIKRFGEEYQKYMNTVRRYI